MTQDLRPAALQARASGDHATAVQLWRMLLDRAPDDWALALELKRDLKAGLHYPDSDPRFRRAARHLPDADWLAHYSALYAFHGTDLDAIDARARLLLQHAPQEPRLHAILGDVARQRRDWPGAIAAFDAAHALDPAHPGHAPAAAAARLYARLAATPWPAHGPAYAVWVVNLDRNTERMEEIARQLDGTPVPVHRVPAMEGKRLAGPAAWRLTGGNAASGLTGDAAAPRGTLGCFLSHLWLWEQFLATPDDFALVLEDDAIPLLRLPPSLAGLDLPAAFDLCFVNDRMEPRRDASLAHAFTTTPMPDAMAAYHPEDNAAGTDGYIISRAGARKLLQWATEDGMADDIDWRLVAWSLTPADIDRLADPSVARDNMARLQPLIGRPDRLDAHVLHPALIRTVGVSSDREDDNRLTAG